MRKIGRGAGGLQVGQKVVLLLNKGIHQGADRLKLAPVGVLVYDVKGAGLPIRDLLRNGFHPSLEFLLASLVMVGRTLVPPLSTTTALVMLRPVVWAEHLVCRCETLR